MSKNPPAVALPDPPLPAPDFDLSALGYGPLDDVAHGRWLDDADKYSDRD